MSSNTTNNSSQKTSAATTESIVLGGGCFWCTEAVFQRLRGVQSVAPGYAGGHTVNPTTQEVYTQKTGHAEVIQVEFNPQEIPLSDILTVFFATHDPTSLNKQGNDTGPEYRSIILYTTPAQKEEARAFMKGLQKDLPRPIVTELQPLKVFYPAEEKHKNFYNNNAWQPYCQVIIAPKISKLKERFQKLLKESEQ